MITSGRDISQFFSICSIHGLRSKDAAESLQRALLGAFVQFDHGAVIQKISLASDFSSIRMDSMDFTSDVESVIDIARKVGFDIEPDNVHLLPMTHETNRSAQITMDDPTFDKRFCDKLRADPTLSKVTATVVSPRLPFWAASRRINCKKVIVSWHRPTRLVWLNFGHISVAQRVSDKFNRGQYRIAGHRVKAEDPTGVTDYRNQKGITVLLQNAPHCITRLEVFDAIKAEYDKPRHIELNRTKGLYKDDHSFTLIKSLLLQIGPLELTDVTKEGSKRFKAVALFNDENDARQAVTTFHNGVQPWLNNDKLSLQLMSSSKFKISSKIYQAVEQQFAGHIPNWLEDHLSFRIYPDTTAQRRFVTLKVEGESVKAVAKATSTIDEITAGKLVEIEGTPCWSSSLASNGPLFQQLKRIETTYGIVILRNKQKRHLRYFGPQHLYSAAQETILAQIKADASTAHIIQLDDCEFIWACRGGFNQVSTALGVKVATFDMTSPPKIIVTGSEEQYREALAIVNAGSTENITNDTRSNHEEDCVICWTSAEDPMTLHCGHIYCLDCFERLCLSGDASGSDFSIECQGGQGTCKEVVTSRELRDHLSSKALEDVLEASFTSYVRHRPQELRCCPSPDCGYVYRGLDITSNPKHSKWISPLLVLADTALCGLIVLKIPYTEIDWKAYMQQVSQYMAGERDYTKLYGGTGPLVYPAAHVYIYQALHQLTDSGRDIALAQYLFIGLYLASLALVMACYCRANAPPYILPLLVLSKRLHSIFMLRLFNDGFAVFFLFLAIYCYQRRMWTVGSVAFSLGLGVKMSLLLALPAVGIVLWQGMGRNRALRQAMLIGQVQLLIGIPFLAPFPRSYLSRAFEFSRQFFFKWTVNWRFVGEETFLSRPFSIALLAAHVFFLSAFLAMRWLQPTSTSIPEVIKQLISPPPERTQDSIARKVTPSFILTSILTAMAIGCLCARSLHYQFYAYIAWSTPFLLWRSGLHPVLIYGVWAAQEWAWNVYPSTNMSSMVVVCCLAAQVVGAWVASRHNEQEEVRHQHAD
ncbi:Hypothetical protein R9X50_00730900 [Acrodontium crateriforme]|uniref:Dol-P-Man:Man(5)GlcNAc(2)-PP-Dol alpha-1,3-mannosyltransferase n=1 Tax=Acrodontium crateriforme TaxID=150365 RepID=A0AAQ3MC92_9PEZI|nr:Hypothetical protein R9X50_00730900 [Acrodontium crateriforme]